MMMSRASGEGLESVGTDYAEGCWEVAVTKNRSVCYMRVEMVLVILHHL